MAGRQLFLIDSGETTDSFIADLAVGLVPTISKRELQQGARGWQNIIDYVE